MIEPILSLEGGAHLPAPLRSALGRPNWSLGQLLGDLELRLGLVPHTVPHGERVQRYAARLRHVAARDPAAFFARSLQADELGTASALLRQRDELRLAGWGGPAPNAHTPQPAPHPYATTGAPRLDALAAAETAGPTDEIASTPDRLARVHAALPDLERGPYPRVHLLDQPMDYPAAWRALLQALELRGAELASLVDSRFAHDGDPDLPPGDLAELRRAIHCDATPRALRGDGTLRLLHAETTTEAAEALAHWLTRADRDDLVIVRGPDADRLDAAMARQGLPTLGSAVTDSARSPLALLALALAVTPEPHDPAAVLELLTLPLSPFRGRVGRAFVDALCDWPGVGGQRWAEARAALSEDPANATLLERVAQWIEAPGPARGRRAPKAHWRAVAERVAQWAQRRAATAGPEEEPPLKLLSAHAGAFLERLDADPRSELSQLDLEPLLALARPSATTWTHPELAGRIDSVESPHALHAAARTVVWWGFVEGAVARRRPSPWRAAERAALAARGVELLPPHARLARDVRAFRRVMLAARERLVCVAPRTLFGEPQGPHPLHDEWAAVLERAGLKPDHELGRARLVVPPSAPVAPLPLPQPRSEWRVKKGLLDFNGEHLGVSALDALLGCPLRWALERKARLRDAGPARLPDGPLLAGKLGHRLVERLHEGGHWDLRGAALRSRAEALADELLAREATTLLFEGNLDEASQLRRQLVDAMLALADLLDSAALRVSDVELEVSVPFHGGTLRGRLDVLLETRDGHERIVDLKWGGSFYGDKLTTGAATQLAAYSQARRKRTRRKVPVAYFSLAHGRTYALDRQVFPEAQPTGGPSMEETWDRLERTAGLVFDTAKRGRLPVVGHCVEAKPPPLLVALGVSEDHYDEHLHVGHDHACTFCTFDALCGKRWSLR